MMRRWMGFGLVAVWMICAADLPAGAAEKGKSMDLHATGAFDVSMKPEGSPDSADGTSLGVMLLDKRFHGPLDASGKGRMLTAMTGVEGSAVYVAVERVSGSLNGRAGSFILRHVGTMDRGHQHLSISVVPDSGTGALKGLTGEMQVRIADGNHFYDFNYSLPDSAP